MDKLVIANWKMNLNLAEAEELCSKIMDYYKKSEPKIIISPPSVYISYLASIFPQMNFAGQNISVVLEEFGAFTGEISAKMLKNLNVNYAIIGHSERRKNFAETNLCVKQKVLNAIKALVIPIICIGENLKTESMEEACKFLERQILESIPQTNSPIIIAYEPVWAIGTGSSPSREYLEIITQKIDEVISKVAKNYQIVYGGSVNGEKAKLFSTMQKLDGFLVGGASLNFEEFKEIVKAYA